MKSTLGLFLVAAVAFTAAQAQRGERNTYNVSGRQANRCVLPFPILFRITFRNGNDRCVCTGLFRARCTRAVASSTGAPTTRPTTTTTRGPLPPIATQPPVPVPTQGPLPVVSSNIPVIVSSQAPIAIPSSEAPIAIPSSEAPIQLSTGGIPAVSSEAPIEASTSAATGGSSGAPVEASTELPSASTEASAGSTFAVFSPVVVF